MKLFLVFEDAAFLAFGEDLFVFGDAFFAADRFVEALFFLFTAFAFIGPRFAFFCFLAGFSFFTRRHRSLLFSDRTGCDWGNHLA